MPLSVKRYPQAVVALAGARDQYQLPLALHEGELLDALITDVYWPRDRAWFSGSLGRVLPDRLLAARYSEGLGSKKTRVDIRASTLAVATMAAPRLSLNRHKDRALGRRARQLALRDGAALFCYNYYAHAAFQPGGVQPPYRFLFQIQADPYTLRNILLEEIERTPIARASLEAEYELSLSPGELGELASEPDLANGWVATSSFAANTLAARGIQRDKIHVVPYGVAGGTFLQRSAAPPTQGPFRIVYVGSLIQRKGLSYLLEAVRLLKSRNVQLVVCARGFIDRGLLSAYADVEVEIKQGLSGRSLAEEIAGSHVFVFPSLAEGFGLVVLEAMSCGVPVITTSHTCGPDVMRDGEHGFIVPIRDAEALAERLAWGIDNQGELAAMGAAAAAQAGLFTWERFRAGVRDAYKKMVDAV